jgi:hypothetical protein
MDGSPTAVAVVTARPRVWEREGGRQRSTGEKAAVVVVVVVASLRHAVTSRLHADNSRRRALASRVASLARACVWDGDGGVASGDGDGDGGFDPDLMRWGLVLGQNEKGQIRSGSISIPGQAEPNNHSGAGQD